MVDYSDGHRCQINPFLLNTLWVAVFHPSHRVTKTEVKRLQTGPSESESQNRSFFHLNYFCQVFGPRDEKSKEHRRPIFLLKLGGDALDPDERP